jgi:hypothetical protein
MLIAQANTPRFKRIFSLFDELLFGKKPAIPGPTIRVDAGNYDDEIQEYLRNDSPPPPVDVPTEAISEDDPDESPFALPSSDLDATAPSPPIARRTPTSTITVQESDTIRTSSLTISITDSDLPPTGVGDVEAAPPKKSRPVPRKKAKPASDVETAPTPAPAPAPTTRGKRASTRAKK